MKSHSPFAPFARTVLASLFPAILLAGCYAFVHDEAPPEFDDPAKAGQNANLPGGEGGPGAGIYNAKCAVCHQMTGKGIPGVYPSLAGSAMATGSPEFPIRIVLHGFQGPLTRGSASFNGVMPPWQNDLNDQQIADVLTFVRSSWGNKAPAVEASMVKKERDATKDRMTGYTETELKASAR